MATARCDYRGCNDAGLDPRVATHLLVATRETSGARRLLNRATEMLVTKAE